MITVIKGKNTGKFAEEYAASKPGSKYYIATMRVNTDEDKANVERHRKRREGMGFMTIEQDVAIVKAIDKIKWTESLLGGLPGMGMQAVPENNKDTDKDKDTKVNRVALIEDIPTLCANEMFIANHEFVAHKDVENTILFGIAFLKEFFTDIVIVTEENPDIADYNSEVCGEEPVAEFNAAMAEINAAVSRFAEEEYNHQPAKT